MPKKKLKKVSETLKKFHEDEEGWAMNLSNYCTTDQAAGMLGVLPTSINHLIYENKLKATKVGRDWLVFRPSLEKYLETKSKRGRPPSGTPALTKTEKSDGHG